RNGTGATAPPAPRSGTLEVPVRDGFLVPDALGQRKCALDSARAASQSRWLWWWRARDSQRLCPFEEPDGVVDRSEGHPCPRLCEEATQCEIGERERRAWPTEARPLRRSPGRRGREPRPASGRSRAGAWLLSRPQGEYRG